MLDRREFLKRCYKIGGVAAIAGMGLGAVRDAMAWGVLPAVVTGVGGGTSWATWDETTESGWGDDANTFIVLFENISAGGNEVGQGLGLSEANRTISQAGAIAGATGSPPTRFTDGTDDIFSWTSAGAAAVCSTAPWTLILKVKDFVHPGLQQTALSFADTSNSDYIAYYPNADGTINAIVQDGGAIKLNATTVDAIPTSGDVYIAYWHDGVTVKFGFTTTRPTKLSDFGANDVISATTTLTIGNFDDFADICGTTRDANGKVSGSWYYFLASKSELIDNAS